jgi:hypothetical protein
MAKLRINGDSSGYVDLEAPNAASSSTLDLDQVPQKNAANTFTANNTFSSSSYFGSEGVRLSTDGSGELGVGYGQTATTKRFSVYNGTSNRFSVSPEGYVLTPNQPAFEVNITTNTSVPTSTAKINFNNINVNTGNHYDGTNDRFVAPVSGKYFISWCVNAYSGNVESRYIAARLYKNGVSHRTAHGQMAAASGSSDYGLAPGSIVVHLNVNDYLEVHVDAAVGGLTMSANNTNFTGFLIG